MDGEHYWFLSDEEFDRRLAEKAFLEYVTFPWGQRSGTLRSEIDRIRAEGRIPLLDLETDGALYVQKTVPGVVTVFVTAPTFEELERRLRARATESAGEIGERLELARAQLELADRFDHVIVNDLGRCVTRSTAPVATSTTKRSPISTDAPSRPW